MIFKKSVIASVCVAIMAVCLSGIPGKSFADMLILPLRVYFKDGDRMKGLTTMNTGDVQAVYRLSFEHKKQLPDGAYENLSGPLNPDYNPADWLVFSPRQVDLVPQAKQAIRFSLRRPADLPDGEYRTHAILKRTARDVIEGREAQIAGAAPTMQINVGFAIPVIVRKGKYDTVATIQNFQMVYPGAGSQDQRPQGEIMVVRKGKYSSIGRLEAYWTPPGGGEEVMVSPRNSLIIYPEVEQRAGKIVFDRPIHGGSLRIVYRGMEADAGIVFDERTFPVQ